MDLMKVDLDFIHSLMHETCDLMSVSRRLHRACGLKREKRKILDRDLSLFGLQVDFSSVGWVLDIHHGRYLQAGFLATLDKELRRVNAIQASRSDWLERADMHRLVLSIMCAIIATEKLRASPPEEPSEASIPSYYAVVVSALDLLSVVYRYLTGNVDRGGSKAYSRSSLDFRDIYIAIVLFLGAYVWIKFREVAFKGVYSRKLTYPGGRITKVVYEPRFKPPRESGRKFEWIYLGQYATREEALILYQIAAFYYNENQGSSLALEDGRWFSIPPMREGERSLTGLQKRAWVKVQVMKVYEEFKTEKAKAAKQWQEFLEAWDGEVPQEQDEVAVSNGRSLGSQEGPALPVSPLTPNTQSGMGTGSSNQLNLPEIVHNQQELISYQQQQNFLQEQQLQDYRAQISELKYQLYYQQLLQDINEAVPSNEVEMEQSMHLQSDQSLVTLPYAGAEAQEAFI